VLIGGGIGLVQGGALVVSAQSDLTLAQDASRFGAGSAQRVAFLEGELQGAWGMLLADVVTGGLLARVGGAGNVGRAVMQTVRTAAVAGGGSAIGTATNPNVWASPDTAGILLKAAVIGSVAGAGGHVAGSWLSRAGNRVMLGLSRDTGPLKRGSMVKLGAKDAPSSTEGRVLSVNGDRVRVATPEGQVDFRVTDAAVVSAQYGSGGGGRPIGPTVAAHSQGRRQAIIDASVQAGPNKTVIHHPKDSEFLIRHALDNPPPKDWWGLTMHGSDDGYFYVARQARGAPGERSTVRQYYLTDEEVADIVRSSGWRQGTPVFLMVCNSGGTHTGRDAMAARLARLLNTHVLAPEFPVAPVPSAFTGSSAVHTVQPAANSMRGNPDSHYMLFNPGGREVARFSPTNLQRAQNVFNVEEIALQATQAIRSGG
ncbi:MAG: hypothetical protein JKY37_27690, partial [Nannocystaceae bacterium]|nr:hypothetical protein [Nannocystaceae bacterium]